MPSNLAKTDRQVNPDIEPCRRTLWDRLQPHKGACRPWVTTICPKAAAPLWLWDRTQLASIIVFGVIVFRVIVSTVTPGDNVQRPLVGAPSGPFAATDI